jgi:hypothetical protein
MSSHNFYELSKILGHSNIKMTEPYAKLVRQHIARTSNTAQEMWKLFERAAPKVKPRKRMYAYCTREKFLHAFLVSLSC